MKTLLHILLYSLCTIVSNAQEFSYNSNNVYLNLSLNWITDSTATVYIELKNTSTEPIYIYPIEESNMCRTMPNFIGIGLYSHIFPYIPRHTGKFSGDIDLISIKPNEVITKQEVCKIKKDNKLRLRIDYFSSSHFSNDEVLKVNIDEYDNHSHFFELTFNL